MRSRVLQHLRSAKEALAYALIPGVALLVFVVVCKVFFDIPIRWFTRDPILLLKGENPFIGMLSNLGVLLWCVAMAIAIFTARIAERAWGRGEDSRFLFWGGSLSALLMLDDLFQLHEVVFPVYFGAPEVLVYGVYGVLAMTYFIRFRATIAGTAYTVPLLALGFFAVSVGTDFLPDIPGQTLVEDGAKFIGITLWVSYYVHSSAAYFGIREQQDEDG